VNQPPYAPETQSAEREGRLLRTVLFTLCDSWTHTFELPASGAVAIGRADDALVHIPHRSVSRHHACLYLEPAITLEDTGSRNGTRVRGVALTKGARAPVAPGDLVECGDAALLLRVVPANGLALAPIGPRLEVGADTLWFRPPEGAPVNLGRRGALRRVLVRLLQQRYRAPGVPLGPTELIAAGWPGERMTHESALARLYTTVQRLRLLGLKDLLVTREEGYLLDSSVMVEWQEHA
jgi:pSer/pThr/pTyr-binding forkhead associated (FHA) protein